MITPSQLVAIADEVFDISLRNPDAKMELAKNQVGNLSIVVDDIYVGYIDLNEAKVTWF